ncbi:MAG: glycerol-3-phosphate dehydrogenase/oxidase [Chryseolinea sp.]
MTAFSCNHRPDILQKLTTEHFDLLIIGGGITGAGIALDAASRGLKTALIEKRDFAFGTSSRSTKLIHGGLRYLKQLEFGLVKEVGSERAVVHRLAPHLVVPEKMLLPLSDKKGLGYWLTSAGLKIYDWLAGVAPEDQRRMLSKVQTLKYEPMLRSEDVKGGAIYAEYRTDDARLTIEIVKEAFHQGATILSYACAVDFVYDGGNVSGVQVEESYTKEKFIVNASVVVSAAGPWVDELRVINKSKTGKRLHLTKGVHIVVAHQRLPVKQAIYFDVDDGRMIFAIPRGQITYIGTTDTNYEGDKDHVWATLQDAQYLVNAVNATFPDARLTIEDIESSWAGLRPLIHEEGKSASELSRKDEIFESPTALISIAGGKLTGYRKMAERVVDLVIKKHFSDKHFKACKTAQIRFGGHHFGTTKDVRKFKESLYPRAGALGFQDSVTNYLVENYGMEAEHIIAQADADLSSLENALRLIRSELSHCIDKEMVCTLCDFFIRRTGMIYFDIYRVIKWKKIVSEIFQERFRWSAQRMKMEQEELDTALLKVRNFH